MKQIRAVVDTNVIISAVMYGGIPRTVLSFGLDGAFVVVTSPVLLSEFAEVLRKKFSYSVAELQLVRGELEQKLTVVEPDFTVEIIRDAADNRLLEAAVAGHCQYIVTGDKELLRLKVYRRILILTPRQFLRKLDTMGTVSSHTRP